MKTEIAFLRADSARRTKTSVKRYTTPIGWGKAQLSSEGATSDLIDRQAAIDALDKRFDSIPMDQTAEILKLRKDLRELPPAQPEPQEGHWINGKCDLCGEHAPFWCMASTYHESNYCPNCGAKMTISK